MGNGSAAACAVRLLVFLLFFGVTAEVLRRAIPAPPVAIITQKHREVLEADEPYDAVFLGSSQVDGQVDPARFDAALARLGTKLRSYNFGAPRMSIFEARVLLEGLVRERPKTLEWVFLELSLFGTPARLGERNERFYYWHDARTTWTACRYALSRDTPFARRTLHVGRHLDAWARRRSGLGRASGALQRFAGFQPDAEELQLPFEHGFLAYDDDPSAHRVQARQELDVWLPGYRDDLQAELWTERERPLEPMARVALDAIVELARQENIRLVLFVAPRLTPNTRFYDGGALFGERPVLAFNDPKRYPQLYEPEVRFDPRHVNAAGAALFSEMLAAEVARRVLGGDD